MRLHYCYMPLVSLKDPKISKLIYFLLFLFPQYNVEGLLLSWPSSCLSSLLDFLFLDPLGKTAAIVFVILPPDPFRKHNCLIQMIDNHQTCFWFLMLSPLAGDLFDFLHKSDRRSSNIYFVLICPLAGDFC